MKSAEKLFDIYLLYVKLFFRRNAGDYTANTANSRSKNT